MAGLAPIGPSTIVGYKPALHGIFAYVEERGKEKVEKWALMQEPASTWWSIGRGTCIPWRWSGIGRLTPVVAPQLK